MPGCDLPVSLRNNSGFHLCSLGRGHMESLIRGLINIKCSCTSSVKYLVTWAFSITHILHLMVQDIMNI